jgi:hypothetical protein
MKEAIYYRIIETTAGKYWWVENFETMESANESHAKLTIDYPKKTYTIERVVTYIMDEDD